MVTVLIIDDDPAFGRLLKHFLTEDGTEAAAMSGRDALALLQDSYGRPHLVILDLVPGMDGREVFQQIRGAGANCPIIFCSAFGAAAANREIGGQGAIEKPFEPQRLVEMVHTLTEVGAHH
jgi:two-component system OmpR family response regulator